MFFAAAVLTVSAQQKPPTKTTVKMGTCGGTEATASIPQATLDALRKAQLADDFDEIFRISRQAGLSVIVRRKDGHATSYLIQNHRGQCVAVRGPTIN
jgi:hypothetical protein